MKGVLCWEGPAYNLIAPGCGASAGRDCEGERVDGGEYGYDMI